VIDGTRRVYDTRDEYERDFRKIRKFIKTTVHHLNDERFNVGVMQYTDKGTAKMEIDFMSAKEYKKFKSSLGKIIQQGGDKRFTGDALVKANNKVCN
jgi:hypothetical protein